MGTAAEKKRLLGGMSAGKTAKRIREIWAETHTISLVDVNRKFEVDYGLTLFALCEMWRSLRTRNKSIELMIASFAETIGKRNSAIHKLSTTIELQRKRLAELEKLVADRKHFSLTDLENEVKYANLELGGNPAVHLCDRIRQLKAAHEQARDCWARDPEAPRSGNGNVEKKGNLE